jgi:hypothetical protein
LDDTSKNVDGLIKDEAELKYLKMHLKDWLKELEFQNNDQGLHIKFGTQSSYDSFLTVFLCNGALVREFWSTMITVLDSSSIGLSKTSVFDWSLNKESTPAFVIVCWFLCILLI